MDDLSCDDDLFDDGLEGEDEQATNLDPPPAYIDTMEFLEFQEENKIELDPKLGYAYIHTYKPYYFPGELVRGSIVLDIFNDLPKKYKQVMVRFSGHE